MMYRPDQVVRKAGMLRYEHYAKLGVVDQLPWLDLTDAQKLPWLLKAVEELNTCPITQHQYLTLNERQDR